MAPLTFSPPRAWGKVLFGLIFGSIGGLALLGGLAEGTIVAMVAGSVFAGFGVFMALYRRWAEVDPQARLVHVHTGLGPVAFRTETRTFDEVGQVSIHRDVRGGKNKQVMFPVMVGDIEVFVPADYAWARRTAEDLATAVDLKLHDSTSGAPVVREPGTFDEPYRDRLIREGRGLDMPEPPAGGRGEFLSVQDGIAFEVPSRSADLVMGAAVVGVLMIGLPALAFLCAGGSADLGLAPFLFFLGLFSLVFFANLRSLVRTFGHQQVALNRESLTVTSTLFGLTHRQVMPIDELEELVVARNPSPLQPQRLVARSDHLTLAFGQGLERDELEWILAMMELTLVTDAR